MVRIPFWIAGLLLAALLVMMVTGNAKLTTSEGCDEWLRDRQIQGLATDSAGFVGLGIGFCYAG